MTKTKKFDKLVADFKKKFPKAWAKPGRDFDGNEGCAIWTGGCWTVDQDGHFRAFDSYNLCDVYEFGVHKDVAAWAKENGLFFEAYDAETFLAYEA